MVYQLPNTVHQIVLNSPIIVGGKISVNISSMGYTSFLVKVELRWVQDSKSSPKSS